MNQDTSTSSEFVIAYEGDDLVENSMSIRDLTPALLGVDELFQKANLLVNGNDASASLRIRVPQPGSFEILFILSVLLREMTMVVGSDYITAAVNLQRLLFGGASPGLFTLIKQLKGALPTVIEASDGNVTIEADRIRLDEIGEAEGFRMSVPTRVFELYADRDIRKAASNIFSPLRRDGIDRMVIRDHADELEHFSKDDVLTFPTSLQDDDVVVSITPRQILKIISPRFGDRSGRWKLNDGTRTSWYAVRDDRFADEVRRRVRSFSDGDILECDVRRVQRILEDGRIKTELEILNVREHRSGTNQGTQAEFRGL